MRKNAAIVAAFVLLAPMAVSGCGSAKVAAPESGADERPAPKPAMPTAASVQRAVERYASAGAKIYCGGRAKPWVALTFDDGPGAYTGHVLAMLHKNNVPATFFLVGKNVETHKRMVGRERNRGAAIGNHSWSHSVLTSLSAGEQRDQLLSTNRAISKVTDARVRLFRPPYMAHDKKTDQVSRRLGMATVLWDVDSRDALGANSKVIARRVKRGFKPGSIILLHENRGQTIRALKYTIIPALRKSGMKPVTVPQMLAGNPPTREQLKRGRRGCGR